MDQTTEASTEAAVSDSTEVADAYAEHVERLRAKAEEEERTKPRPKTCNITFQLDEVNGLLGLIEDNIDRYKVTSQALLVRAATKLRDSLLIT